MAGHAMDDLADVIRHLDRALAVAGMPEPEVAARHGLMRLSQTSSHLVYEVVVDGRRCCVKVFRSWARDEPLREWLLLKALERTGVAPQPLWRTTASRPAVVTGWVDGEPLAGRTTLPQAVVERIAEAHNSLHAIAAPSDAPIAINAGSAVAERVTGWWADLAAMAAASEPSVALTRHLDGAPIAESSAAAAAVDSDPPCLVRGDTNLANYLTNGSRVRMLDFEDGGIGTATFEVADMIEHFANRTVAEDCWRPLTMLVDADRLQTARAVVAEFWLALTIRRNHRGLTMRPAITPAQQLERLLALRS